jgi:hypothetical protein
MTRSSFLAAIMKVILGVMSRLRIVRVLNALKTKTKSGYPA